MTPLADQTCEPCRIGGETLNDCQLAEVLKELPEWACVSEPTPRKLQRVYRFKNFLQAMQFTQQIGELAESFNHHPRITLEWGQVEVVWWTHKINNIHRSDAVMAAKTEALFNKEFTL